MQLVNKILQNISISYTDILQRYGRTITSTRTELVNAYDRDIWRKIVHVYGDDNKASILKLIIEHVEMNDQKN